MVKGNTLIYINLEVVEWIHNNFVLVLLAVHLVELVFLAELNTLFPAVVALEEVCSDPPKLDQLMLL